MGYFSIFSLWLFSMALIYPLTAEIERISVIWNPQICLEPCVREITKQLRLVNGIAEIVINSQQGEADIRWKPKVPFSYDYIKTAFGIVGATIRDVRVQVRGTLAVSNSAIFLESLGDNTRFVLLGPAQQSFVKYVPQKNFETHPLSPEMQQQLLAAARESCVVVVKGPLLRPLMGLYLVVEQLSINRLAAR
jgi:hypothetical protein